MIQTSFREMDLGATLSAVRTTNELDVTTSVLVTTSISSLERLSQIVQSARKRDTQREGEGDRSPWRR